MNPFIIKQKQNRKKKQQILIWRIWLHNCKNDKWYVCARARLWYASVDWLFCFVSTVKLLNLRFSTMRPTYPYLLACISHETFIVCDMGVGNWPLSLEWLSFQFCPLCRDYTNCFAQFATNITQSNVIYLRAGNKQRETFAGTKHQLKI